MKVNRAQAERNHRHIIDVAGQLFREHGFDGIGITELMKSAGLTHGGFYNSFASKEDLAAQACERAFEGTRERWESAAENSKDDAFSAIVEFYLSKHHCDHPGTGCALAALAPDAARHGGSIRSVFTRGIRSYIDTLSRAMPGRRGGLKRKQVLSSLSEMVGAVILARACDDPAMSKEILEASLSNLKGQR
ncbi:TetR/AcrR family transcriptional repressor of nem operon [Rhizobium sp. BK313]|uniref:TetR/AcrR family transcriptional regulator n=1 Tax=Rhizobium sp. BK313 TaxID=2587081 RepID=UPI00105E5382|nr:TetR/AcrR family transcriptional regulator [Rhizobium sp. BK313]MBB3458293.1 TetR/AcrR family transcriptional repressor of nem operon [Rhizobium sp. BK313]